MRVDVRRVECARQIDPHASHTMENHMTTESLPLSPTVIVNDQRAAKSASTSSSAGHPLSGTLWFAGWLFTIGFSHLIWWKALLALIVWPYFLGIAIR